MTVTTIDRKTLGMITDQFLREIKGKADALGIDVRNAGGTYGGGTGTVKISISVKDNGTGMSGAEREFRAFALNFPLLDPDAFGKVFMHDRGTFEVCCAFPNSPKYCFGGKCLRTGRIYKFTGGFLQDRFPKKTSGPARIAR